MDWGLILYDDGTKGAFELGVWKGLMEYKTQLATICSGSAGLFNAALMVQGSMNTALDFWSNAWDNPLLRFNQQLTNHYTHHWSSFGAEDLKKELKSVLLDENPSYREAKNYLNQFLDENAIRHSSCTFIVNTFHPDTFEPLSVPFTDLTSQRWLDDLLLGFFYPIFPNLISHLTLEADLLDSSLHHAQNIEEWVTVGFQPNVISRWKKKNPHIQNIHIIPSEYLGLAMEDKPETVLRNMEMGYLDTLKKQGHLIGKFYYLDFHGGDSQWNPFQKQVGYPIPGEDGIKLDLLLQQDGENPEVEPMARLKHLLQETLYKDQSLALSMLEITARSLHIPRLKRYTTDDLIQEIFRTINSLLAQQLDRIKAPDHIQRIFQGEKESILPQEPLMFLSSYVYFLSLRVHSTATLLRLKNQFSPETILSIATLMYLSHNEKNRP